MGHLLFILLMTPPTELLEEIARLHAKGATATVEPFKSGVVALLNTAPADMPTANPALLRDVKVIAWPKALRELAPAEDVADARRRAEKYLRAAAAELAAGPVAKVTRERLAEAARDLDKWLGRRVSEYSAREYAESKEYVGLLAAAATLCELPHAKEFLPGGTQAARGDTPSHLTRSLTERRLRLVGPRPGDESAYAEVRKALETYRNALRVASPK